MFAVRLFHFQIQVSSKWLQFGIFLGVRLESIRQTLRSGRKVSSSVDRYSNVILEFRKKSTTS